MQNIPGIVLDKAAEQASPAAYSRHNVNEQQQLFADLFDQHASRIENELAMTPVSTTDKMLAVTPEASTQKESTTAGPTERTHDDSEKKHPVKAAESETVEEPPANNDDRDADKRMTQEDLDEVRDDLKEYGFSEKEIDKLEEEINSEDGMTWGQFLSAIADKMKDLRKVTFSDDQKQNLTSFFSKLGFSSKESAAMITQLENGDQADVMAAISKKLNALSDAKHFTFTHEEVEAFASTMNFSKEFTSQLKDILGKTVKGSDLKDAFSLIRQEMKAMDLKDRQLVQAVSKQFAKALGKDPEDSTVAQKVKDAMDLKPRVGKEASMSDMKEEIREDFHEAVDKHKETTSDNAVRKADQKATPEKAQTEAKPTEAETGQTDEDNDHWTNFLDKTRAEGKQTGEGQTVQTKTEGVESSLKTGLADATGKTSTKAWEKVSAPKVMRQVENAIIKTLNNGTKQLTLQLTPENLGKLSVLLQVNGKEVSATIRAENHDAAKLIADNLHAIKQSLESQGLKVDKLDVQAGLTGDMSQNNGWFGANEHNMARDREAMVAMRKHMQHMRQGDTQMAQEMQSGSREATVADQGLHVIA